MKNKIPYFLVMFLIKISLLHSQSKSENYYDSSFQKISKEEFEKLSKQKGYSFNQYDLEDQVANILFKPKTKGKLTSEEFNLVKKQLNKISPLKNGYIIIIYYPGKDSCNEVKRNSNWNIFDKDYQKEVNKLKDNNQYWIYKNDENLKYYYPNKVNWTKDENQILENIFFKMHYPCASSAVIDENGNFISNLGEFGKHYVIEDIKELIKLNSSNIQGLNKM